MGETLTGLPLILDYVTNIVTSLTSWVGQFISVITASGNEFLLLMLLVPIIGFAVGILRRLINLS